MSNTKTLPLEDIMGISKSWLEEQIKDVNNGKITATKLLQDILRGGNLFPIKPIVDAAWENGCVCGSERCKLSEEKEAKQSYLSQPITIKTK